MPELTITQIFLIIAGLISLGIAIMFATGFNGGIVDTIYLLIGLGR